MRVFCVFSTRVSRFRYQWRKKIYSVSWSSSGSDKEGSVVWNATTYPLAKCTNVSEETAAWNFRILFGNISVFRYVGSFNKAAWHHIPAGANIHRLRTSAMPYATSQPTLTDKLDEADKISTRVIIHAGPSGRAVKDVCLPPLAYWDCGFESCRRHGCLSLASVLCCQVEVSTSNWSLVQSRPWTSRGCGAMEEKSSITGKMCAHPSPPLPRFYYVT